MMGEEFDQWFEINHNRDLYDAWCAGAAAQRKRDAEIAKTEHPKHLFWYPKGYSLDPNKINDLYKYAATEIAAAIERQKVDG